MTQYGHFFTFKGDMHITFSLDEESFLKKCANKLFDSAEIFSLIETFEAFLKINDKDENSHVLWDENAWLAFCIAVVKQFKLAQIN